MAYQKTNWVNGYTPLNASNMNKIEEGIFNNDTFLSSLDIRVNTLEGSIGQGGIGSVVVSGNGNALNNVSYDPSTKILNFEKNNTFALGSDLDSVNAKNLYHLGAYDSVSGNIITRQTGYINVINLINNFTRYQWNDTIFQTTVPLSEINTLGEETSLRKYILSDNINYTRANVYGAGIPNYTVSILKDKLSVKNTNNDINVLKQYLLQHPLIIQYKLATSYTEQIIEGQPLNILDQQGSQWLRSEWEKGLNLFKLIDNYTTTLASKINDSKIVVFPNTSGHRQYLKLMTLKKNVTYTVTTNGGNGIILSYSVNENIVSYGNKITFTTGNTDREELVLLIDATTTNQTLWFMLNYGDYPYPYQEYQGGIVREKQLNDRLNNKIFDANNSTMNDVLDYIRQNYDHIISIIYYARSEGESFGRSVIYNADKGILAYITSGLTFANVTFNTDAEEGSDYIIIYKEY